MKLWEILPQLQEGQEFRMTYKDGDSEDLVYANGGVRRLATRTLVSLHAYIVEADYEIIPQSVPFEEALKAYKEGKQIGCVSKKYNTSYYSLHREHEQSISFKHEILEGKWFIC